VQHRAGTRDLAQEETPHAAAARRGSRRRGAAARRHSGRTVLGAAHTPKSGEPPHFKAFTPDEATGTPVLAGLAFWTTELEPLERGYDGPIKVLVGMDPSGVLTGIVVVDHHEPYGYFSVDLPAFAAQFKGKSIREPFRLGGDIDAVSRATMTVGSATRAVRNSARRVATALLKPSR
jgi:NosR/NirI family nitrous oxide reductase transcriptional regulator